MISFRGFSYYQHRDDAAEASITVTVSGMDASMRVPLPDELQKYIRNFVEQAAAQAMLDTGTVVQHLGNERRH